MINGDTILTQSLEISPLETIPQFRIIGSKYNILLNIYEILQKEKIEGKVFFDVFSGSAVVGRFFKKMFSIISNDNLYFSYVLQRALIVINKYPSFANLGLKGLSKEPKKGISQILDLLNSLEGVPGFIYLHYTPASKSTDGIERRYFSESNGLRIDAIRLQIEKWFNEGCITNDEYFYLLGSLLLAVQKIANISGTYGAFNKFWDPRAYKPLTLKFIDIIESNFDHVAFNEDSFNLVEKVSCDIAYIDPPYNSRQYITNYHLLETIARYDSPKIKGKTGLREYTEKEKSAFCCKKDVGPALYKLLNKLKAKHIILSYNSEGLLSKEEILQIFKKNNLKKIKFYEIPYRRFKSNYNSHKDKVKEYIFIGTKENV